LPAHRGTGGEHRPSRRCGQRCAQVVVTDQGTEFEPMPCVPSRGGLRALQVTLETVRRAQTGCEQQWSATPGRVGGGAGPHRQCADL
jgi:hypothetical protein